MFMIEDIWCGRFTPSERMIRKGSRYQEVSKQGVEHLEDFRKELSAEGKKAFDDYYNTQMELWGISEQDAFTQGLRFGVRLMLDVVGEYHSDLPMMAECV